jgi:pyruvate/2-oxoglutarate dehydrogenase complex dihydrolipoamide acyltransferase (E2) component
MEIPVLAERTGVVAEVMMAAGCRVAEGDPLVVVAELPAPSTGTAAQPAPTESKA